MTKLKMCSLLAVSMMICSMMWGCAATGTAELSQAPGDRAQDFTLPDQNGNPVTLSEVAADHRGVILAFYPKDDSRN